MRGLREKACVTDSYRQSCMQVLAPVFLSKYKCLDAFLLGVCWLELFGAMSDNESESGPRLCGS